MRRAETCTVESLGGAQIAAPLPEECAGFLRQIGSPEVFPDGLEYEVLSKGIGNERELRTFLETYQSRFMVPLEIPAIAAAHQHAAHGHGRELIALDGDLSCKAVWPALASASRRIGKIQIKSLRPLRDERTVQRYLAAVESGEATGWHTVVYGITLAVYSWPLRHGLLTYGRETLAALALAARPDCVTEATCLEILESLYLRLPEAIEQALAFIPSDADTKKTAPLH